MGRIVVRSNNVLQRPLLETGDAGIVEYYDCNDELMALFIAYPGDMWAFVNKGDPDWDASLARYGYKHAAGIPGKLLKG